MPAENLARLRRRNSLDAASTTTPMLETGDEAPDFAGPLATAGGDLGTFRLSDRVAAGEAPLVLAFFPAAFSSTCTEELCTFRDEFTDFGDLDAGVYGISADLPYALQEFRATHDLGFGLVSDTSREAIDAYDLAIDFDRIDLRRIAQRAVFVVDADRRITYRWVADNTSLEPDYQAVAEAVWATA